MSVPDVDQDTIVTINREFWNSMTTIRPEPVDSFDRAPGEAQNIAGQIEIQGGWSGSVEVCVSPDLARDAAAQMIGKPPEEVSLEDCFDAVQEATNIIAGSIKRLLPPLCRMNVPAMRGCRNLLEDKPEALRACFSDGNYKLAIVVRKSSEG